MKKRMLLSATLAMSRFCLNGGSAGNTGGAGNARKQSGGAAGGGSQPERAECHLYLSVGRRRKLRCNDEEDCGAVRKITGANTSVENQGGAGGTTATTDFVGAATDGTAICLEAVGVFTLQPFVREVGYSIDDFTPVAGLTTEPIVMVASKNSGVKNMEELLAKGTVSYGFNGAGSLMELCQKKFFSMTDLSATGVSYDGSSETIAAALGGHIDVAVAHPADILQYIETGDLYPIGIFSSERDTQ